MDYFSVQETFNKMFPNSLKTFTFDSSCIRQCECIMTEGLPNIMHHVEYHKVKVTIENMEDQYVAINPHREVMTWSSLKNMISQISEVYIHPDTIKLFLDTKNNQNKSSEYNQMITEFMTMSGMSKEQIESKLK